MIGLIVRDLVVNGSNVLSRVATSEQQARQYFDLLCTILAQLGLHEVAQKACPPTCIMTWLGLQFDTRDMSVTTPVDKLSDIMLLIHQWGDRQQAKLIIFMICPM